MIKLKAYSQTKNFCGVASLRMILRYYGILVSEEEIAEISGASHENGVSGESLVKAANYLGLKTLLKINATIDDLRYYIERGIPVIVAWFCGDGHYSVVVDVTKKDVVLIDPIPKKFLFFKFHKNRIPINEFLDIWYDSTDKDYKIPDKQILRSMLVVFPPKGEGD